MDMESRIEQLEQRNAELLEACELLTRGWDRVRRNCPKATQRFREWAGDEATDFLQGLADARAALAKATDA